MNKTIINKDKNTLIQKSMCLEMNAYLSILQQKVYDIINQVVNDKNIDIVINDILVPTYLEKEDSSRFNDFYFNFLEKENEFLNHTNFFKVFRKQYSLQGIDNNFLNELEKKKREIIDRIQKNQIAELFFYNFKKVDIKHKNKYIKKDLGSFFAKLIHTLRPNDYCALDNPIKNFFGLKKESFFVAFIVISTTYKQWAANNQSLIKRIRTKFKEKDTSGKFNHTKITDLKLLDLIFWSIANH